MNYFIRIQGKTFGPLGLHEMLQLKQRGKLKPFHEVSLNQVDWASASEFAELFPPIQAPTYAPPDTGLPEFVAEVVPNHETLASPQTFTSVSDNNPSHLKDLHFATLLMAVGILLHFLAFQFQLFSSIQAIPNLFQLTEDRIVVIVITIFALLIMFSLFIISNVFILKASSGIKSKGIATSSLILTVLALIFFLSSSVVETTGKTIEARRIGLILGVIGSVCYHTSFAILSFLFGNAFLAIRKDGQSYACNLQGAAWVIIIFIFSLASFVISFLTGQVEIQSAVFVIAGLITVEMLLAFQILLVWFLYQTFALRFYLRKSLIGN